MMKDNSTRPQSANRFYEMRSYLVASTLDRSSIMQGAGESIFQSQIDEQVAKRL
jgi:hypothetical protein